jgi:hypothetical protein
VTIALPKGDFLVTAGFAAITGAGVASGFTVLSTTSTWLLFHRRLKLLLTRA